MQKRINPVFSIIIPNFNGEEFLETCLSSLVESKYSNFEVLVYDDGSTDNSSGIIEKFTKKDKRIKFFQNSKNIGAAATRNLAVKQAAGEYLLFLDNDTKVTPDWLQPILDTFTANPRAGADRNHGTRHPGRRACAAGLRGPRSEACWMLRAESRTLVGSVTDEHSGSAHTSIPISPRYNSRPKTTLAICG